MWDFNHRNLRAGVVVDSNLFVLLLVAHYDRDKIIRFRATRKYYGVNTLELLEEIVGKFRIRLATTNIYTEVDNLSRQVDRSEWPGVSKAFADLVGGFEERIFPSENLIRHPDHPKIGLTDCSIVELAKRDVLVATDDLPLTVELERRKLSVINLSRYVQ